MVPHHGSMLVYVMPVSGSIRMFWNRCMQMTIILYLFIWYVP